MYMISEIILKNSSTKIVVAYMIAFEDTIQISRAWRAVYMQRTAGTSLLGNLQRF